MSIHRGNVLVAESDATTRNFLGTELRRPGFEVECVDTAERALAALSNAGFDALLVEAELCENTDLDPLKLVRSGHVFLPVFIMSGQSTAERETATNGTVGYLSKPVQPELLCPVLDAAIQKARVRRAVADARQHAAALTESVQALEQAMALPEAAFSAGSNRPRPTSFVADPLEGLSLDERGRLSPREREIARFLAAGCAAKDVALRLDLSPNTVRNHVKSIFAKLQVHSHVSLLSKLAGRGR